MSADSGPTAGFTHLSNMKRRSAEHPKYVPARADGTGREIPLAPTDEKNILPPQQLGSDELQKAILTNTAQR